MNSAAGKAVRGLRSAAGKASRGFVPAARKAGKGLGTAAGKAGAAVKGLGSAAGKAGRGFAAAAAKAGAAVKGFGPALKNAAAGIGAAAAGLRAFLRSIAASAAKAARKAAGSPGGKKTAANLPARPAKRRQNKIRIRRRVRRKPVIRGMAAGILLAAACIFGVLAGVLLLGPALHRSTDAGPGTAKTGESLEMLLGQKAGAENTPLAESLKGILNASEESLRGVRRQMESSLREEYLEILDSGKGDSFRPKSDFQKKLWEKVREERREELQEDPFLILVNKWHYLPEDYEVEPVDLPNGQRIGSLIYDHLEEMLADCAEAGGTPIVCSGYRPHWYQVDLFSAQIDRWLYAGYGQEEAESLAATAVAVPGTSEHELGLAADIYSSENMDLDESQIYTFTQQWLMENCWRYGFVLRYPQDKSDITGIIFEPWHYRYVGLTHAKKIFDAGICLEEYLDETEHP